MSGPDMPIRTIFVCGARLILCDYQFRVSIGLSGGVTKTIFETSSRIRENPNSEKEIPKAVLYTSIFDVIQGRFAIPSLTNSPLLRHTAACQIAQATSQCSGSNGTAGNCASTKAANEG